MLPYIPSEGPGAADHVVDCNLNNDTSVELQLFVQKLFGTYAQQNDGQT
jgi:hypothetical protein